MIRAVLNCLSCGSENRRNRCVFNFVHVCLLPAFNSVHAAVRI